MHLISENENRTRLFAVTPPHATARPGQPTRGTRVLINLPETTAFRCELSREINKWKSSPTVSVYIPLCWYAVELSSPILPPEPEGPSWPSINMLHRSERSVQAIYKVFGELWQTTMQFTHILRDDRPLHAIKNFPMLVFPNLTSEFFRLAERAASFYRKCYQQQRSTSLCLWRRRLEQPELIARA